MWRYRLTDHEPRLLAEIQRQQNRSLFCDTLLQTSGVSIPAHSCIIAALSPYLSQKLSASPSSPSAENRRRLQLGPLSGHALLRLVGLLYSGELTLEDPTEREEVLAAARRLRIGGLVEVRRDGRRESEVGGQQQQSRRARGSETRAEIRVGEAGVQTVKCNEQATTGGSVRTVRSSPTEPLIPVAAPCLAQGRSDEDHCAPGSSNLLLSSHRFNPNDESTVVCTVEETPNATYGGTWNWTDTALVTLNTPKPPSPQPGYYTTSDRQETLSEAPRIPAAPQDTNPESVEELPEEVERFLEHIMMIGLDMYGATTTITTTHQSSVPHLSVSKEGTPHPAVCTDDRTASDDAPLADTGGFHSACNSHFVPAKRMPGRCYPDFTHRPETPQRYPDLTHHPETPQRCPDFTHHPETPQRYPDLTHHPETPQRCPDFTHHPETPQRYPDLTHHPETPQRCPDFTHHPETPQRYPDLTHHPETPQRCPSSTSCHSSTPAHYSLRRPAQLDGRSFQNTPGVAPRAPFPHSGQPSRRPVAPPRIPAAPADANPEAAVEESPEEIQRLLEDIGLDIMLPSMSLERNYISPNNHLQPNLDGATTTTTTTTTTQSSVPNLSISKQGTPHPAVCTEDRTASHGASLADTGFQSACNSRMPERYPDFTHHPEAPQRCPSSTSCHSSTTAHYSLRRPARLDERSFQNTPGVAQRAPFPHRGQPSRRHYPARPQSSRPDSVPCEEDVLLRRRLRPSEPRTDTAKPRRPSFGRPANHGNTVQRSWLMTKPGVLQFPLVPRVHREEPCPSHPRGVRDAACSARVVERRNDSGPSAAEVATGSGVEDGGKRRRYFTSSHTLSRKTFKLGERCPSILRLGACSVRLSSNIVMAKEREMAQSSRRMPLDNAGKSKTPPENKNEKMKPGTSSSNSHSGPSVPGRSGQTVDLKRGRPREMKSTTGSAPKRKRVRRREMKSTTISNGLEETHSGRSSLVRSVQSVDSMAPKRKRGRPRKIKQDHVFPVAPSSDSSRVPTSALCDIAAHISDKPSLLPKSNSTPEEQNSSTPEHAEGPRVIKTKRPPTVTLRQFQELIQHRHWRTRESKTSSQEEVSCGTESSHEESARESEMERESAQMQGKGEVYTISTVHGFPFDQNPHRIITAETCGSQEADKKRSQHEKMHEKKQQGHQSQNKNYISSETVTETEGEESSNTTGVFKSKEAVVNDVPSEETCQVADNGGEHLQGDPDEALEVPARTSRESDTERPADTTEDCIHSIITERPADTTEDCIHSIILMLRECRLSAASLDTNPSNTLD